MIPSISGSVAAWTALVLALCLINFGFGRIFFGIGLVSALLLACGLALISSIHKAEKRYRGLIPPSAQRQNSPDVSAEDHSTTPIWIKTLDPSGADLVSYQQPVLQRILKPFSPNSDDIETLLIQRGLWSSMRETSQLHTSPSTGSSVLTGDYHIDAQLDEILRYIYRDNVHSWYQVLASGDGRFLSELDSGMRTVIRSLSSRLRQLDQVNYLTTTFVDDFASHLRLYRLAKMKLEQSSTTALNQPSSSSTLNSATDASANNPTLNCYSNLVEGKTAAGLSSGTNPTSCGDSGSSPNQDLHSIFFSCELSMERTVCRDYLTQSPEKLYDFLSTVCDILEYLLLPIELFQNRPLRLVIRTMLVKYFLEPLVEKLSDPDFINQTIVWMCKNNLDSSDEFLSVLRSTESPEELAALREAVDEEIAALRSQDTGGADDFEIKQQLSSLTYVQGLIASRVAQLATGDGSPSPETADPVVPAPSQPQASTQSPQQNSQNHHQHHNSLDRKSSTSGVSSLSNATSSSTGNGTKLFSLPFEVIMHNQVALSYFIEYMSNIGAQGYVYFYLNVEGFKISAEQQLSKEAELRSSKSTKKSERPPGVDADALRNAAQTIYETYLHPTEALHRLNNIDPVILERLSIRIYSAQVPLSPDWFDEVQCAILDQLSERNEFYMGFKQSNHYVKLLNDLDLQNYTEVPPHNSSSLDSRLEHNLIETGSLRSESGSLNSLDDEVLIPVLEERGEEANEDLSISSMERTIRSGSAAAVLDEQESLRTTPSSNHLSPSGSHHTRSLSNSSIIIEELIAEIFETGMVREFGNVYGTYAISVCHKRRVPTAPATGKDSLSEYKWVVVRRFSDFYKLHHTLISKFPYLDSVKFPAKKAFNNTSREFMEQRRSALNLYLQQVVRLVNGSASPEHGKLRALVFNFLKDEARGATGTSLFGGVFGSGTSGTGMGNLANDNLSIGRAFEGILVNPLKTSVKTMGNIVKTGSDSVLDGLQKIGRTITTSTSSQASSARQQATSSHNVQSANRTFSSGSTTSSSQRAHLPLSSTLSQPNNNNVFTEGTNPSTTSPAGGCSPSTGRSAFALSEEQQEMAEHAKVSANLDPETEENIPLRIILLLMDEVFDLKSKNLWLRRRIVTFVRQIIAVTFGDSINRRIVDYVQAMTSGPALAEYLRTLKNNFWPSGVRAQTLPERSPSTKARTRIAAKMLLLASVSDELKHVIGSETIRKGVLKVFDLFQMRDLNTRLVVVLLEGLLTATFPHNHFPQIFHRIHLTRSPRLASSITNNKGLNRNDLDRDWPPYLHRMSQALAETSSHTSKAQSNNNATGKVSMIRSGSDQLLFARSSQSPPTRPRQINPPSTSNWNSKSSLYLT